MSHFLHLHDSPSQVLDKVQVMLCLGGHAIDKKGKSAFLANLLSSDSQLVERLHGMGVFSVGSGFFFEDDKQYYTVTTSLGLRKTCKKCMLACFQDVPEIPPRVLLH